MEKNMMEERADHGAVMAGIPGYASKPQVPAREPLDGAMKVLNLPIVLHEPIWLQRDDELKAENERLRQRVAELEAQNADLDAFAHTVAHDLKGPIGIIAGYTGFLREAHAKLDASELETCLEMVRGSVLKLSDIVDELLLLAGIRQDEIEIEDLDMSRIVNQVLQRLRPRMEQEGAQIVYPERWPGALGYGPWIEEVWVNYIDNAIKYGGSPPYVDLGAEQMEDAVRFWVRDNGQGLTREQQGRLFTPFTRLEQVRTKGHGLGLSIVRHIIERLGGAVSVESHSQPGAGSMFSFILPAALPNLA
jgi:signal transduction histidine kinase